MKAVDWKDNSLVLLDQTCLPAEVRFFACRSVGEVAEAITGMKVRGAPAIGVAAAYGIALAANSYQGENKDELVLHLQAAREKLAATRPTAVNLFWALDRMKKIWQSGPHDSAAQIRRRLEEEAVRIQEEDLLRNRQMGQHGCVLIPEKASILTHCNAGALATAGYGTALGVIRAASEQGKDIRVYADETRPLLQGARLTAWELLEDHIPVTLITDNMAGYLMQQGKIDLVLVGADRITSHGDVANKIGTYSVAVLAQHHKVPFYVAAPLSTIDPKLTRGEEIPIEERAADEVRKIGGVQTAPAGVGVYNPAFDVTPAKFVTAIITEKGVCKAPYGQSIKKLREE